MTFEEWLKTKLPLSDISKKALARAAWEAATEAERDACYELMDEVGAALQKDDKSNDFWTGVGVMVEAAESAIRERSND
jgi:hypothetical protein